MISITYAPPTEGADLPLALWPAILPLTVERGAKMAAGDLVEGILPSETLLALWYDKDTREVLMQYGYVALSMPMEDFSELVGLLQQAQERLEGTAA
ncbi:MAG TPA: hypothetical protein ENI60_04860 [Candidatus Fraserbacteria bacterium]|nr:hypothetical protein [Candidatus Fraserbacteria bacterium]